MHSAQGPKNAAGERVYLGKIFSNLFSHQRSVMRMTGDDHLNLTRLVNDLFDAAMLSVTVNGNGNDFELKFCCQGVLDVAISEICVYVN